MMKGSEIHVFLDSTVLYKDPFWRKTYSKILLNLKEKFGVIHIYISSIVLSESENNYKKLVKTHSDRFKNSISELNPLLNKLVELKNPIDSLKESLNRYRGFYESMFQEEVFKKIHLNNEILPEIIDRAINRKEPFFTENNNKKKQEFRDATIWLTYTSYIRENNLKNCFFISNNRSDFWDNELEEIHPSLISDCNDIKIYHTLEELILKEKEILKVKKIIDFEDWLNQQEMDIDSISKYLNLIWPSLIDKVKNSLDSSKPDLYFDDKKVITFKLKDFNKHFEIIEYDISSIEDRAYIKINADFNSLCEIYKMEFYDPTSKRISPLIYVCKVSCDLTLLVKKNSLYQIDRLKVKRIELIDELF